MKKRAVTTWDDLKALLVLASLGFISGPIYLGASITVPAGEDVDCRGLAEIASAGVQVALAISDGSTIRNLAAAHGVAIGCQGNASSSLVFDGSGLRTFLYVGAPNVGISASGSKAAIQVEAPTTLVMTIDGPAALGTALINVDGQCGFFFLNVDPAARLANNWLSGSGTVFFRGTSSAYGNIDTLTNAGFSGSVSFSHRLHDDAGLALGADATANRPAATQIGQRFFDTTLGIPIWWNGSDWIDATGSTV